METINALASVLPAWFTALGTLVTAATAVTALTPTKVDDNIVGGLGKVLNVGLKVLNIVAGNVLLNKNAK